MSTTYYTKLARTYWETYLPEALSNLANPQNYFEELTEEIFQEVCNRMAPIQSRITKEETDFMTRLGRINMAQLQVEAEVFSEMIYLPPEPGTEDRTMPMVGEYPGVETI
jgi:hypothetical protein